ncbi:carbohydrate-binding family 9-like protein [Mucilaginibacter pedocola]|uniref:Carbohydrate-binding domain-containing protein n=1 Tax=Mucilaginibacter pedocola TaxID=1792845 RepID=A0A1S9PFQ1_9SPHI|nr:carbohydrate-binding family 9-like protein [Mucilaginibacter pedocola]OOQ59784.1 hypothetical protein BC343_06440 [Mucilaginibacter pedocola]
MTLLNIPYIPLSQPTDTAPPHKIENEPWAKGGVLSCSAAFAVSHFDEGIRLRFVVNEPHLNARKRPINSDVHNDNCVEFFIAFGDEEGYYNIEFNCLGSIKAAYGKNRFGREFVPAELLNPIVETMVLDLNNNVPKGGISWDISAVLPLSVFCYSSLPTLSGTECAVNFTKCGDQLPVPHFLSWVKLDGDTPDFHQPQCFAKVVFDRKPVLVSV